MSKIWDFHGGVHPVQNKAQSNQSLIVAMPLPAQLVLPLSQHIGSPAKAIVGLGEYVLKGQLIASAQGFISANVHAPTSGHVSAIELRTLPHQSALSGTCIVIDTDGKDQWGQLNPTHKPEALPKADLLHIIQAAGITGLGGAGFPSVVKLQPKAVINTLVINGAECEPYITSDDRLMREYAAQMIAGIQLVQQLLDHPHCLIGIEDNKPEAIVVINELLGHMATSKAFVNGSIEVCVIPTKYPSGGEKQLIEILTGQQVPHGGIPADIGIVCQNVGTVKAIHDAVVLGQPLISRITTVTGKAAADAGNYEVLIGTQVSDLLAFAKVDMAKTSRVVMGGPMMGFTIQDTHIPLIKSSNCVLAAADLELAPVADHHSCIRCGLCEVACPAQLLPQQLFWFAKAEEFEKAEDHDLSDCIECGACAWVCPSQIPLVQYYRFAKGRIKDIAHEAHIAELSRVRFESREQRLIDDKLAKEEKRKNRAATAAAAQAAKRAANPDAQDPIAAALARVNAQKKAAADTVSTSGTADTADTADTVDAAGKTDIADAANAAEPVPQTHAQVYKELKTAAAITRTKLNKTSKALANALAKDHELAEGLQATVHQLTDKAAQAQAKLQAYETKLGLDPEKEKALQVDVAKANAMVRKLEKALATAQEPQNVESELVVARVSQKTASDALEDHLANITPTPSLAQES